MSARKSRRAPAQWGTVELLPSGRYRAFYRRDGAKFTAPRTFATRDAAHDWLAAERADRARGTWLDPRQGRQSFEDYARAWLESRPDLAPRTAALYAHVLERWLLPRVGGTRGVELGAMDVADITPTVVRAWYAAVYTAARDLVLEQAARQSARAGHPARAWAQQRGLEVADTGRLSPEVLSAWRSAGSPVLPAAEGKRLPSDPGRTAAANAYRLLRTILNTAVREGLLTTSPCQVPGAGTSHHRERPTATPAEVVALAAAMPRRLAAAVMLAAWSGLRYGELFALAREHVDLEAGTVRVERALVNLPGQPLHFGKTKTRQSNRVVHVPRFVLEQLAEHMAEFTEPGADALLFTTDAGTPVSSHRLSHVFMAARRVVGRTDLHWHDLRHTGATLAYSTGASMREVQNRLGHATMRAAAIYAHASDDSDRLLAHRLDELYGGTAAPKLRAV